MRAVRPRRLDHFGFCDVSNRCLRGNSSHFGTKSNTDSARHSTTRADNRNKPTFKRDKKELEVISSNNSSGTIRIRGKISHFLTIFFREQN